MKKYVFTTLLVVVCLTAYGQKSSCHSRSSSRYYSNSNERNDSRATDRNEEENTSRRRFTVVIPGRRGGWEIQRYDNGRLSHSHDREPRRVRRENVPVFTFGPKVGANYATFLQNPISLDADYKLGYHIGGFMRFNFRRAYIQPEVLYSTKGGELDLTKRTEGPFAPGRYKVNTDYIDVPLLLGARLVSTRHFNFRVFAGPMASFNIGGQGLDNFLGENETTKDYLEDILMGYQAGVGVDLGAITLDTRYEWTLNGAANLQQANLGKPRNGLIQASLGIKMF